MPPAGGDLGGAALVNGLPPCCCSPVAVELEENSVYVCVRVWGLFSVYTSVLKCMSV